MTAREPATARVTSALPRALGSAWAFTKQALAKAGAWAPIAGAVAALATWTISRVLAKIGHPGAPLDDAYIHFQYARALVEGHPMRFQSGQAAASGATSLLWPALLAPFWAIGAREEAILWPAWGLSFVALGALAWEAKSLVAKLAGSAASVGAAIMILSFGGLVWCAASGMEVVPFAWLIARAARRASQWAEAPESRSRGRSSELIALAWAAAFMRPEGALTVVFVAATLGAFPGGDALRGTVRPDRHRRPGTIARGLPALAALGAVIAPPLVLLWLTGSARSNTAVVKLLPGNPYYAGYPSAALLRAVRANVHILVSTLLDGEVWASEFLPRGGAALGLAGLASIAWLGHRRKLAWRALAVLLIACTMFAPCFYVTFLWNRLRYLWPFATGWIIGLACLARVCGDMAASAYSGGRVATPLICGLFAGLFASKLDSVIDDVAQSASGIDRQQVALGHWARASLPADARIGVNDTGAIAYFGRHPTFDVVGLTTQGEARYWVAGAASRFEHYERLKKQAPEVLPTHFIVYPEWMAMDAVLGAVLTESTVTDSTIVGGRTMRAYVADWSTLGSGDLPWTRGLGPLADALDVADLDSEREHNYDLAGARDGEEVVREAVTPMGAVAVDGGRTGRSVERFTAHLHRGVGAKGVVRAGGSPGAGVRVLIDGEPVAAFDLGDSGEWVERAFDIPASAASQQTRIELRAIDGVMVTYHYWFVQ